MRNPIKTVKRVNSYRRLLRSDAITGYEVVLINENAMRNKAKSLHASVYLHRKYIEAHTINMHGHIAEKHDPYQNHSDYFAVTRRIAGRTEVVVTARQIQHLEARGHQSFPTVSQLELYPDKRAWIMGLEPSECVEISALAKRRGESSLAAILLYRAMWQHSLEVGQKLWIMSCDTQVYKQLKFLFGDALVQIGPEAFYMGSNVVPAVLEVDESLAIVASASRTINPLRRSMKRSLLMFFARGLPLSLIDITNKIEAK